MRQYCQQRGYCAPLKEEDVSIFRALATFAKEMRAPGDLKMFAVVLGFLISSLYFEVVSQLVTGRVLTSTAASALHLNGNQTISTSFDEEPLIVSSIMSAPSFREHPHLGLIAAFVIIRFIEAVLYLANVYVHHRACMSKNAQLEKKAFAKVLSLDQTFFDSHTKTETESGMRVHSINNLITWNVPYLIYLALKLTMTAYFMVHIDARMGIFVVVAATLFRIIVLAPIERREKAVRKCCRKSKILQDQIKDETFNHLFSQMSTIKTFSKERAHFEAYSESVRRYMSTMDGIVNLRVVREFLYRMWKIAFFATALIFRGTGDGDKNTAGFFLLLQEFLTTFGRIKWHWEVLVREFPEIQRFLDLMSKEAAVTSGSITSENPLKGDICFKNVSFEFPSRPGQKVLRNLTMKLEAQKITAIVGDSGAGKSTIIKLLMRMYDPVSGSITVGGIPMVDLHLETLHRGMAIVSQSPALFDSSLADNIAYGSRKDGIVSDEEIHRVAKIGNCFDFISAFRAGFDTFAGSRGASMSGGQKQRVAIARAALRDPSILILDEATSALDADSEAIVQESISGLMAGRTVVIIAHRLSTIRNADIILAMKDGKIVESGTHKQLVMREGGYYRKLVEKQMVM